MKFASILAAFAGIVVLGAIILADVPAAGQERSKDTAPEPRTTTPTTVAPQIAAPAGGLAPSVQTVPVQPAYSSPMQPPGTTYYPAMSSPYRIGGDREMDKLITQERLAQTEAANLIREYGSSDNEDDQAKIKTKLKDTLNKQFEWQQKRRDLELSRLEAQVKKLRNLMKKRNEARPTIIDRRLDQLLREAEGLGWSVPPGPHSYSSFPFANDSFAPSALPKR